MSETSTSGQKGDERTKVFAGRYAYKKPLGRGAGGSVYLAEDLYEDNREVALKVLSADACDSVQGKMLRREFEILSKLDHPNLVRVYDYGTLPDGGVYLAEEYIDGFSLQDARALLEPEALIDATLQVLQGLAYLHGMRMIHRDVKPANVMLLWLDDASARPMVKLVDFGLSSMDPGRDTLRGGTRSYMAPEIIRGNKGEYRSDLYSLGVTLYYALCGVLPWGPRSKDDPPPTEEDFSPPDPHRLNDEVPLELSRFTMALLRQVEDVDYTDAGEALQALAADAGELEARSVGQMANSLDVAAAPVIRGYFERGILPRRVEEDDLILEWLSAAEDPTVGQMHLIRGREGVGKSRLLADVQASSKLSGHLVLSHDCQELSGPFSLIAQMLERLVELADSHDVVDAVDYVSALEVRRSLTNFGIAAPDDARPADEQAWLREAIEEIIELLGPRRVVFFIDDLDEADDASIEVLHDWFRPTSRETRPAVVATTRAGEVYETFSKHDGVQVLPIEGVGPSDTRAFFREQLGIEELSEDWIEAVGEAADGRPAYVEELCRYLIDAGMLWRESADRWTANVDDIEAAGIPETLRESLRRRVTEVGAAGRECLELLALMDRPIAWKSARTLLERGGASDEEAEQTLQTVQWRHLISTLLTHGGRYVQVVHRELADAVADMISPQWERALHRRIGKQVAVDWRAGEGDALEAATHLAEGGLSEEAAPYFEVAGDLSVHRGDHREAARYYERALEGLEEPPARAFAHLKLARSRLIDFDARRCREHFKEAVVLAAGEDRPWLKYRAFVEAGQCELSVGDVDEARRWAERTENELPGMTGEIELSVLNARIALDEGDLSSAGRVLERCQRDDDQRVLAEQLVAVLGLWGRIHVLRGRQKAALKSYRRARRLADRGADPVVRATLLTRYGTDLRRLGSPREARASLQQAVSDIAGTGPPDVLVELLLQMAWTDVDLGDVARARRRAREARCLARHLDHEPFEQQLDVFLAGLDLREQGADEEILEQVRRSVETFDRADDFVVERAELLMALGDLMIAMQIKEQGPGLLQRGRQIAYEAGARGLLPPVED